MSRPTIAWERIGASGLMFLNAPGVKWAAKRCECDAAGFVAYAMSLNRVQAGGENSGGPVTGDRSTAQGCDQSRPPIYFPLLPTP